MSEPLHQATSTSPTMAETRRVKVLFVCLGNICRSPMAEAVFAHIVKSRKLVEFFEIDSAGTAGYHVGETPDERTVATCKKHGVQVKHLGRKVALQDYHHYDWILCMDKSNLSNLTAIRPDASKATIQLFGDFDPKGERIIQDPYYGGIEGFETNFQQLSRASAGFLEKLGYAS
ncbi:acid phosphatase [Synchytrium endobioticum]|uniref:Acid phosphatase n=1 Tax=Synchytrium endobioticum TaxID=286115 RepID=A0A507DPU5_9FUNG|nr:acid phosphatase [Synchytrium endobioticum]TPX53217.1 acid phosphatase [Synchytrium endobioticum]